jgi:hypothetical protein
VQHCLVGSEMCIRDRDCNLSMMAILSKDIQSNEPFQMRF